MSSITIFYVLYYKAEQKTFVILVYSFLSSWQIKLFDEQPAFSSFSFMEFYNMELACTSETV